MPTFLDGIGKTRPFLAWGGAGGVSTRYRNTVRIQCSRILFQLSQVALIAVVYRLCPALSCVYVSVL